MLLFLCFETLYYKFYVETQSFYAVRYAETLIYPLLCNAAMKLSHEFSPFNPIPLIYPESFFTYYKLILDNTKDVKVTFLS